MDLESCSHKVPKAEAAESPVEVGIRCIPEDYAERLVKVTIRVESEEALTVHTGLVVDHSPEEGHNWEVVAPRSQVEEAESHILLRHVAAHPIHLGRGKPC